MLGKCKADLLYKIKQIHTIKVARVVNIKLFFFMDWFYYDLIILSNTKAHIEV